MAIIDEPVRGSVPLPWFRTLPGLERIRALANGLIVRPPLFELLDLGPGARSCGRHARHLAAARPGVPSSEAPHAASGPAFGA